MKAVGRHVTVRCQDKACGYAEPSNRPSRLVHEHVNTTGHVVDVVRSKVTTYGPRHPKGTR
jgi:hypothetical protein